MNSFYAPAHGERRNISLPDLVAVLQDEANHRLDVIAGCPPDRVRSTGGVGRMRPAEWRGWRRSLRLSHPVG